MQVRFLDVAAAEFDDAVAYYEAAWSGLGEQFRQELAAGLQRIERHPLAWRAVGPELRRYRLRRFPYSLIYHADPGEILVVAVAHQHRRPGYWRDRVAPRS